MKLAGDGWNGIDSFDHLVGAGDDADAAPGRLGNGAAAAARMAYSAGAD